MKHSLVFLLLVFLSSCSYSVIMNTTHGKAEDSVDSAPKVEADISTQVDLPAVTP